MEILSNVSLRGFLLSLFFLSLGLEGRRRILITLQEGVRSNVIWAA